ncbi:hypothetical protein EGW08_020004, partial [Elysia chlorotica]
ADKTVKSGDVPNTKSTPINLQVVKAVKSGDLPVNLQVVKTVKSGDLPNTKNTPVSLQVVKTVKSGDVPITNKLTNSQCHVMPSKESGTNQRQENTQIANGNRDGAEVKSTYRIVLAPTLSKGISDIGDNAHGLPLQIKFPKAQFSHSMQQKVIASSNQLKQSHYSQNVGKDHSSSESAQSNQKGLDAGVSNVQNECSSKMSSSTVSGKKTSSAAKEQLSVSQADNVDSKPDASAKAKKIRKPRKSKYCTVGPGYEGEIKPKTEKLTIDQDDLAKVYKTMTETNKVKREKPESETLKAMRLFRERLLGQAGETANGASAEKAKDKSGKVVLDAARFL